MAHDHYAWLSRCGTFAAVVKAVIAADRISRSEVIMILIGLFIIRNIVTDNHPRALQICRSCL